MSTVETRLEMWDPRIPGWWVTAAAVPLLHPEKYAERLAKTGKVARATVLETGEVFQTLPTPTTTIAVNRNCEFCGDAHAAPYDGMCLL